jgi:type III secretory pathway component EscS
MNYPNWQAWITQVQTFDNLIVLLFVSGLLIVGYYWLGRKMRWMKNSIIRLIPVAYLAILLALILYRVIRIT